MPQAFVLLTDSKIEPSAKKGMTVYSCVKHDYGSANDDTRMTGIHHVSLTLDATGDYPFFTHAFKDLEKVEADTCAHSWANKIGCPECGELMKKLCACPVCNATREAGSIFCQPHQHSDSRLHFIAKTPSPTNEQLAYMMQRDGEQQ